MCSGTSLTTLHSSLSVIAFPFTLLLVFFCFDVLVDMDPKAGSTSSAEIMY